MKYLEFSDLRLIFQCKKRKIMYATDGTRIAYIVYQLVEVKGYKVD